MAPLPPSKLTSIQKRGNPEDPIVLYGIQASGDLASSLSPFVAKVETFLRMAGLDYTTVVAQPSTGPKGKIPYIKHGKEMIPDSYFIIKYLMNTYGTRLRIQNTTDPLLQAQATAAEQMAENCLLKAVPIYRGLEEEGFNRTYSTLVKALVPYLLRPIAGRAFRNQLSSTARSQGWGLHSEEDYKMIANDCLESLSTLLGNKAYLGGEVPIPEDAALFACLDQLLYDGYTNNPVLPLIKQYPNVVAYVNNVRDTYYPPGRKPPGFGRI